MPIRFWLAALAFLATAGTAAAGALDGQSTRAFGAAEISVDDVGSAETPAELPVVFEDDHFAWVLTGGFLCDGEYALKPGSTRKFELFPDEACLAELTRRVTSRAAFVLRRGGELGSNEDLDLGLTLVVFTAKVSKDGERIKLKLALHFEAQDGFAGVDVLKAKCLVAPGRVPMWKLDAFASPAEGGTVTATPDRERYPDGTLVRVRVEPAPDYFFKKWKGDAFGKDEVSLVLMDDHRKAKAKLKPLARVEVELQGAGAGRVTGLRIDCGEDCEDVFAPKFEVKLRAFPAPGSTLAEWIGCDEILPDGRCLVVAKGVRAVQAVFEPQAP